MSESKPKPMSPERINQITVIQHIHGWFVVNDPRYEAFIDPVTGKENSLIDEAQAKEGLELAAQLPQDYDELMAVLAACGFTFERDGEIPNRYWLEHETEGSRGIGDSDTWCNPWLGPAAILFAYLHDNEPFPGFIK